MPISMPFSQQHSLHSVDKGSKVIQDAGILLQHYMASQPRRPQIVFLFSPASGKNEVIVF
jgi:hypothetical protein